MLNRVNNFQWSFSRMKNFFTCPKRHWEIDIAKNFKEAQSPPLLWGNRVHEAMDKFITRGTALPSDMQQYQSWVSSVVNLRQSGWTVVAEAKLAMSQDFQATAFFDPDTWCRGVVDATAMKKGAAITLDWKTGAIHSEYEQLAISAQLIFAKYPQIKRVSTIYAWLADRRDTRETFRRVNMTGVWNQVLPKVKVMEEAARTVTYPPKPSGLCVRHCPVSSCPYHGKGNKR